MTKADVFAGWRGREDVVDLHVAVRDHNTVNQQLNQLAALRKGGVREALAHPLAEDGNGCHDLGDGLVLVHLSLQLLPLPLQCAEVVVQPLATPAVLGKWHRSCLVGIAYPLNLALDMPDPLLQLGASRLQFLRQPRPGLRPLARLGKAVRVRQHIAQVLPDEVVERRGWNGACRTAALRVLRPPRHFAGAQILGVARRFVAPLAGVATDTTAHQGP